MALKRNLNTFSALHLYRRFHCFAVANETEHVLNMNSYKYPVSFTKCITSDFKKETLPTILLPAMGQYVTDYRWLKEYLSQYNDVITMGHTSTPHHQINEENTDYLNQENLNGFEIDIESIKNTMDYFGVSKSNFLGISFGAMMIQLFARKYQHLVNSMVLSSAGLYISDFCEENLTQHLPTLYAGDVKTSAKVTAETFCSNKLNQRLISMHFCSILKCNIYAKQYGLTLERIVKYFHFKTYRHKLNLNTIGPNIQTLLICAESDGVFRLDSSLCLAETIKNCRVDNVDGGHLWMLNKDKQEMFCKKTGDFLYHG